ncbi:MAG: DegV family protein [Peptostreptococcaceae bacterium]
MSDIKIICESISDLPTNIEEVEVLPVNILFEGVEYRAGVDISTNEFYKLLRNSKTMPTTSQITYKTFTDVFERYLDEGKTVIYMAGSSSASGTYQSAVLAKNDIENENLHIFDTYSLSAGGGMLVYEASKMVKEGFSVQEILAKLETYKEKTTLFFSVDSLEYLQKGGRISGVKAAVGSMLNIKPILKVEDGLVKESSKVRGSKKIMPTLIKELSNACGGDFSNKTVYVGYGDDLSLRDELLEKVKSELNPKEVLVFQIGSCVACHSGPDVLGLGCLNI